MSKNNHVGLFFRLKTLVNILAAFRIHEFRAAKSLINKKYKDYSLPVALLKLVGWSLEKMWVTNKTKQALQDLSFEFSDYKVALLHGKMRQEEKDMIMKEFKSGLTNIYQEKRYHEREANQIEDPG